MQHKEIGGLGVVDRGQGQLASNIACGESGRRVVIFNVSRKSVAESYSDILSILT